MKPGRCSLHCSAQPDIKHQAGSRSLEPQQWSSPHQLQASTPRQPLAGGQSILVPLH